MEDETCFIRRSPVSGFGHTIKKAERPRERSVERWSTLALA